MGKRAHLRVVIAMTATVTTLCATGCQLGALSYFLLGKEATVPPRVQLLDGRKDSKKILVLASTSGGLQWSAHPHLDDELGSLINTALSISEERFQLVSDRKVRAWRDLNPGWVDFELQEVGKIFKVDYVLKAEIVEFSMHESKNQYLYKGKTTVLLKLWDVHKDSLVIEDVYQREYPAHRVVPVSEVSSDDQFRKRFLANLAREISWYFIPHRPRDEIADF